MRLCLGDIFGGNFVTTFLEKELSKLRLSASISDLSCLSTLLCKTSVLTSSSKMVVGCFSLASDFGIVSNMGLDVKEFDDVEETSFLTLSNHQINKNK